MQAMQGIDFVKFGLPIPLAIFCALETRKTLEEAGDWNWEHDRLLAHHN
jgi:hypothetical protein